MVWPFKLPAQKITQATTMALNGQQNMLPAAYRVPSGSLDSTGQLRPSAAAWQQEVWQLWDDVGELHAPSSYIARIISRLVQWSVDDEDAERSLEQLEEVYGK